MAEKFEPKQFGRYVLLEKLAMGGMAEIYKAKTYGAEGFEKLLAIKRILPHAAADKEFIHMLIDEAKLSVMLSHANIVQVYDLAKVGEDYFISMEFINGVNLRDMLYRLREHSQKMLPELAVYTMSEVCKGLDYAHRKTDPNGNPLGIVHRDISPQNVLLSYEGEVKIVDFGIAKAAMNISHTMAGILKGKIAYMSPEQAMGKAVDYRTDIFSTGIMLYEALTAQKLFTGESQFEVLKQIRTNKIDLQKLPANIPIAPREILAKSLAYRPEDRYQSAGDMQLDLTKYLYSTYIDFSPQKLAAFVRETFKAELKQQEKKQKTSVQTVSIKLDIEAAKQEEDIVHRETDETMATPLSRSRTGRTKSGFKKGGLAPLWIAAGLLLTVGLGFGLYKFLPRGEEETPPVAITPPPIPVVPKPAEPVPVAIGTLSVISDPLGAVIFVDGKATGSVTPATVESLPLNKDLKITLSKPKYQDYEQTLHLSSTTPQKLSAVLAEIPQPKPIAPPVAAPPPVAMPPVATPPSSKPEEPKKVATKPPETKPKDKEIVKPAGAPAPPPVAEIPVETGGAPATLKVASSPSGAEVFINAEYKGTTPLTLQVNPGKVSVLVNKEGRARYSQTLNVKPGQKVDLSGIKLGELYGQVSINSTPSRAEVILDGQRLGAKTPVTIRNVRRDKGHSLRLELDGYDAWETNFTIEADIKKFNILFER